MKKILAIVPFLILMLAVAASAEMGAPQVTTDMKQAFLKGKIIVKGEATADQNLPQGQRKLMAMRGAKAMAYREIAELLEGVLVTGETTVANTMTQSDVVRTSVQGMVKGAQVVNESYDPLNNIGAIWLAIPMSGADGVMGQLIPQLATMMPPAPAYQPPAAPPTPARYDGLIIDVKGQAFKPALINRVLTKNGEIIYDPSKVAQNILVERGAAEYTNDVGKAKALLGERGAANPLVVKADSLVKSTDAVVGPDDATSIFSSNQASNYLEGAKVVFVLK
ncbi:hypothetical protein EPN18_06695 [bacterium]|nr:MAG: hypothetical protein EPN18_06695 [bacterium]